jgi:hypothetical protein
MKETLAASKSTRGERSKLKQEAKRLVEAETLLQGKVCTFLVYGSVVISFKSGIIVEVGGEGRHAQERGP